MIGYLGPASFPAHFDIDVPQGKQFILSTGVYDWLSGKAGTLQIQPPVESAQNTALPAAASK